MGGSGSGRWGSHYLKAESKSLQRLDLAEIAKDHSGRLTASHALKATFSTADGKSVTTTIALAASKTRFGGGRLWMRCPDCGARRRVLYAPLYAPRRVACRLCLRLRYSSQSETWRSRTLRAMHKIERRLAGEICGGSMPPKPRGMHWRTYDRIAERHEAYSKLCAAIIVRKFRMGP
jgi:hypothetical protein